MDKTMAIFNVNIGSFQFATGTILGLVRFFINIAVFFTHSPKFLCRFDVMRVGGADKIQVIAQSQNTFEIFKFFYITVHKLLGRLSKIKGLLINF